MNILSALGTHVKNHVAASKGIARIVDTESNITARSTDPAGTLALGTDTNCLYIHTGGGTWMKIILQAIT